ncbi:MAG: DUF488 family protein [Melioribacteraceae bacterium]|nr:MAG: DUF488 family protein [Melioribacteraceae bacterium]
MIKVKRVYEEPSKDDGLRILVDRLWPRGLTKEKAKVDLWLKEISPSNELRKWYHDNFDEWNEFKKKYKNELKDKTETVAELKQLIKKNKIVTFVYSSKEEEKNNAVALKEFVS